MRKDYNQYTTVHSQDSAGVHVEKLPHMVRIQGSLFRSTAQLYGAWGLGSDFFTLYG